MGSAYTCKTCGLVATDKGHLCNPVMGKKVVACKYCGTITSDPRHVCAPKVMNLKYSCTCGRLAAKKELLCHPTPLAKPKKTVVKAAPKETVKPIISKGKAITRRK